ncbi:MAG: sugar phosphate isomerase/epimerase [Candidatus Omnitrophica bacterium]|nr:sugar phosphate isomerase/epimerase [Candidatus Omnitrophota bacterium]MCM8801825.1 sugar phosphate isomerase/epimerase [Candidatus Omnitrophota bacterium]
MKIGICNEIFQDWELEEIFYYIKSVGYEGIEIAPFTLADDIRKIEKNTIEKIKNLSEKTGIKIIGTHWLLVKPEGLSISSKDPVIRKKTSDYLCKLVDFTSDISGELMVLGSPKQRKIGEGQTYEEVKQYLKEVIEPVLEECSKKSTYLCIEPLAKTETNFINKAEQAIEIIEEINHPNLKLHLDVKAMSDEGKPIPEIIEKSAKYLKHFHVNDKNLLGPGFGEIDYKPIIDKLKEIGYSGWLSVEVFDFSPGPKIIAEKSLQYLKNFL